MRTMKILTAGAGVLIVVLTTAAGVVVAERVRDDRATGRQGTGTQDIRHERPLLRFLLEDLEARAALGEELDLTAEQKQQISRIIREHRGDLVPRIKEVVLKRRALRQAVCADNATDASIRAAADAVGQALGDAAVAGRLLIVEIRRVLTPEQIDAIRRHKASREAAVDRKLEELEENENR